MGHTAQVIILAESSRSSSAIAVGIYSAIKQYSVFDYVFTSVSFLGFAMPTFWLALLLQILVRRHLPEVERADLLHLGPEQPRAAGTWSLDRLQHIALPVSTL